MNAELFYLVGKPNSLKQLFVEELKLRVLENLNIFVPDVYTTNPSLIDASNYKYIDERDFSLRSSMGMYCLDWKCKDAYFGVSGDLYHRLNNGVSVVLNGSVHNVEDATAQFPNMNTLVIEKQNNRRLSNNTLIAENDDVVLEWSEHETELGYPYILSMPGEEQMGSAVELFLNLINYETSLDQTG